MTALETISVYRDGMLLHLPGANPGTPYTNCGLDAGLMVREVRSLAHAGMWCRACFSEERVKGILFGTQES